MVEKSEDYAVATAQEWFAPSVKLECIYGVHCVRCAEIVQSTEENVHQLATIIRKHVGAVTLPCGCPMSSSNRKAH